MKADSSRALLLDVATDIEPLKSIENEAAYGLEVDLSGDKFDVIFDTGSSDLWVFKEGVECLNSNGNPVPDARCGFGPEFEGNFDEGEVDNQNFVRWSLLARRRYMLIRGVLSSSLNMPVEKSC